MGFTDKKFARKFLQRLCITFLSHESLEKDISEYNIVIPALEIESLSVPITLTEKMKINC